MDKINNKICMLKLKRLLLRIPMNLGNLLAKITPPWKMRKLFLYFTHRVAGDSYRGILDLDDMIYELESKNWHCNSCGKLVFKGDIKSHIVLNCPHCGAVYRVRYDSPRLFKKRDFIQSTSVRYDSNHNRKKELVDEDTVISKRGSV